LSPINGEDEDTIVLEAFFNWKIKTARTDALRIGLSRARLLVERELLAITDLRTMENPNSAAYKHAIASGMPEGLIRLFREELRTFKAIYRQEKAAQGLLAFNAGGEGSFLR
jgi:hypothetical protein